jgi:hypothetical protein
MTCLSLPGGVCARIPLLPAWLGTPCWTMAVATCLPRTGGICRRTAASAGTLLGLLFASHCRLSALCKPCIARCSSRAVPIGRTQGSHAWGSAHLTPAPFANSVLFPLNEMNLGMHHQTLSSILRSSLATVLMIANFWDPSLRTYEHLMALTALKRSAWRAWTLGRSLTAPSAQPHQSSPKVGLGRRGTRIKDNGAAG